MLCIRRPAGVPLSRWGCQEFDAERVRDPRPRRRTHSKATRHALGCVRRARGGGVPEHCLVSPECRAPRRFKAHQASGTAGRARSAWQRGARRRPLAAGDGEAGERGVLRNPGPSVRRLRTAVEGLLFDSLKGQVERVAQRMVVLERVSSQLSSRVRRDGAELLASGGPEGAEGRHPVHLVRAGGSRERGHDSGSCGVDIVGGLLLTRTSAGVRERDRCAS